jgi:hypothetical protein
MSVFIPSDFGPPFGADFVPKYRYISDITQAQQAVVAFTEDHTYVVGEWIGFRVPPANGMIQLNNQQALIVSVTPDTVKINLNTLQFWPFISTVDPQYPCIAVPVASGIIPMTTVMTLEDAFDNRPVV